MDGERFDFRAGEVIRLFFSYRYTPERMRAILNRHGLDVCDQWKTRSEEEGVFLCRNSEAHAPPVPPQACQQS
jgi:uncharacterized SAM-dependent methyltransferase